MESPPSSNYNRLLLQLIAAQSKEFVNTSNLLFKHQLDLFSKITRYCPALLAILSEIRPVEGHWQLYRQWTDEAG
jgi:hypothetical protein